MYMGLVTFAIPPAAEKGRQVSSGGCHHPQLDSEVAKKIEWLTRLKMRKHLGIKDFVDDEDFRYHGRLILTLYLSTGTYTSGRPELFKPGEKRNAVQSWFQHL